MRDSISPPDTNDDWHEVFGLNDQSRVFYLLYASANGGYVDNSTTLLIMETFLSVLGLGPIGLASTRNPGRSHAGRPGCHGDVRRDGSGGGEFAAQVVVTSNDPITPEVAVPASLDVIGESDITVTPASLAYGPQYVGAVVPDTLTVTNDGCELLTVSSRDVGQPGVHGVARRARSRWRRSFTGRRGDLRAGDGGPGRRRC